MPLLCVDPFCQKDGMYFKHMESPSEVAADAHILVVSTRLIRSNLTALTQPLNAQSSPVSFRKIVLHSITKSKDKVGGLSIRLP